MMDINTKPKSLEELMPYMKECMQAGLPVKFSPRGTSMLPMIRQTIDYVELMLPPETLKKYDIPLYQRDNGQYVLHRVLDVRKDENGRTLYTCCGDNQFEMEVGVRQDQVIAVLTAFTRGDKVHKLSEPSYQMYCRFWHYSRPIRQFTRRAKGWLRRHLK